MPSESYHPKCSIEGCERPHYAHSLCNAHWQRIRRSGTTRPQDAILPSVMFDSCTVPNCERPHYAKGFCEAHLYRYQKYGDPLPNRAIGDRNQPIESRFLSKIRKDEESGCWLWLACTGKDGYGYVRYNGRRRAAHIVSYLIFMGPIPEGLELDHLCRVRNCINPAHLEAVTRKINVLRGNGPEVFREKVMSIGHQRQRDMRAKRAALRQR